MTPAKVFFVTLPVLNILRPPLQVKEEYIIPQIKLEPHEVDQFLNLSPKGQSSLMLWPKRLWV